MLCIIDELRDLGCQLTIFFCILIALLGGNRPIRQAGQCSACLQHSILRLAERREGRLQNTFHANTLLIHRRGTGGALRCRRCNGESATIIARVSSVIV